MTVTKARLVKAAEELNRVLGLEPAINVEADENTLVADILEAAELLQPEDELTKATLKVIADLESGRDAGDTDSDEDVAEVTDEATEGDVNASEDTSDEDTAQEGEEPLTENAEKVTKDKKEKGPKRPGVIATIVRVIEDSGDKGVSKEEILDELVKVFPDRSRRSMGNTVNVQVPTRINKERFPLEKLEDGRFRKAKF